MAANTMMKEETSEADLDNRDEDSVMEGIAEDGAEGDKKKRHRRKFAELERIFTCPYPDCGRPYASDHSLQQHIRIKEFITKYGTRAFRTGTGGPYPVGMSGPMMPMYGGQPPAMMGPIQSLPMGAMRSPIQSPLPPPMDAQPMVQRVQSQTVPSNNGYMPHAVSPNGYMSPGLMNMQQPIPEMGARSPMFGHSPLGLQAHRPSSPGIDLARQMYTMNLASPNMSQPTGHGYFLEPPKTLHRNRSAPQLNDIASLLALTDGLDVSTIKFDSHTNSLHVPSIGDLTTTPQNFQSVLAALHGNQHQQPIEEETDMLLSRLMAETAVLDNVLGVDPTNHMIKPLPQTFGFSDPMSNPQTLRDLSTNQSLNLGFPTQPDQGFGIPSPNGLAQTTSLPMPNIASDSMARFLQDISETLADVDQTPGAHDPTATPTPPFFL